MAQQDLSKTPLNDPNQEVKIPESTLIERAPRDYFQEAMDVRNGIVREQPTNTDFYGAPIAPIAPIQPVSKVDLLVENKTSKEIHLESAQKYRNLFQSKVVEEPQIEEDTDALFTNKQIAEDPYAALANFGLNLVSGATDVATGVGQILPSEIKDQDAESEEVQVALNTEQDLLTLLERPAGLLEKAKLSKDLEKVQEFLQSPYGTDIKDAYARTVAAYDGSESPGEIASNTAQYEYALSQLPTNREFRERVNNLIEPAVATYDFLEVAAASTANLVNKSLQDKITQEVTPYATDAAKLWEEGNYVKSIGEMADGIFTVALDNPQGAVEMFLGSLPQMVAIAFPATAPFAVTGAYVKHSDTMMENYVEINGERATGKNLEMIQLGAASATLFDFFSDKVALKGLSLIPLNTIGKISKKLGSVAPKGLKTVTEYTASISGKVAGLALQPAQEFISGAGTELSEQAGVAGTITGDDIDATKVIKQGMIESIALAPVQAASAAIKTVAGTVTGVKDVSERVSGNTLVKNVRESAGVALDKLNKSRLDKRSNEGSAVYKAVKFSQENAENINGTVEESTKYVETLAEMIEAAQKEIEDTPENVSPEALTDYQMLMDIQSKVSNNIAERQELGEEIDLGQLAIDIENSVKTGMMQNLSEESRAKLKGGVLYSMQIDDSVTEEQANVFIEEGNLNEVERKIAVEYVNRIKGIQEVSSEVVEGEGDVFVGAKAYARTVQAAVLSGNTETATKSLEKFTKFSNYMSLKATVFKNVWQHNIDLLNNKNAKMPEGIEIVSQDETGKITEFKILDIAKYGITTDGASKVWNSKIDGAIRKLGLQVAKETKIISSYLAQATEAVGAVPAKVSPTKNNTTTTETNVSEQEEYLNNLNKTSTVTKEDVADLIEPTVTAPTVTPKTKVVDDTPVVYKLESAEIGGRTGRPLSNFSRKHLEGLRTRLRQRIQKRRDEFGANETSLSSKNAVKDIEAINGYLKDNGNKSTKVPPVKKTTKAVVLNPLEDKKTKSIEFFKRSIGTLTAKIENSNNLELIKRWEKKIVELEERISLTGNIDSTVPTKDSNVIEIANFADGRLASTNNGIITVKKGITKEEVLAYITNNKTRTGSQKAVVTQHMSEEYGVDLLSLLDGLNEKQIKEFIVEHEKHHITQKNKKVVEGKAHINNYGTDVSFSIATALNVKNASDNFFLNDTAIMMEAGANIKALRVVLNDSTIGSKTASVVAEVVTEAESELVTLDPNVIMLTKMIAGMKRDQEKAKKPETYTKRIDNLEIELQEATDKINAKEAARLADPKRTLEVYDLSKSIFTDETVELEYLAELYGQDVQAIYLGSSIWGEDADARKANRTLDSVLEPKSTKEIQSEEAIKENLNSRNLFKTVRNVFGAIKKSSAFLKMSPAQLVTVQMFTRFNTQFTSKAALVIRDISDRLTDDQGNYTKIVTQYVHDGVQMDRFQENPLNYLLKRISVDGVVKGYLDPNILSMMAMHGMEYLATLASSTVYNNDEAVKALLNVDSKAKLSMKQMAPFRKIGTSKSELASTIGRNIVKQLGLKGTPLADENLEAQLATALGLVTIDILIEMDLLEATPPKNRSDFDVDFINKDTDKLVEAADKGQEVLKPESDEVVNFVRVKTERKGKVEVVRSDIAKLIKNYSLRDGSTEASISNVLNSLFGVDTQKRFALFNPVSKRENSTYLRTDVQIPEQVRKDLEYAQSVEWRFKPAIVALFSGSSREESIQALKDVVGYQENLDDVPEYFKEAKQAVNDSLLREIEDAVTFFDMLADKGQDQFYYSYNSWNNSRSGMNESAVSPQSSKIVRHLIYPTDPVTQESFNQELTINDPFHMQMFKIAIIQSLYPETAIDKNTIDKINIDFKNNFDANRRNKITKAARSINTGTNPIVAAKEAGLTDTIGIDGLVALATYYKALKEKSETFTVDVGIETDATTSGLIISLLNSGRRSTNALTKLAAGGGYTTVETNYVNYNAVYDDNYESLANIWAKWIKENDTYPTGVSDAVIGLIGMPERADAKDPVMQSNYFAQENTLVSSFVDSTLDKLMEKLTDPDEKIRLQALEFFNEILQQDYTKLGGKKSFIVRAIPKSKLSDANYKSFLLDSGSKGNFQEIKFRVVVAKIYGGPLRKALAEEGNEFEAIGTQLNEAGNIAFYVYETLLNHVTKAVKGTTDAYYITNKQREAIENDPRVKALFPTMRFVNTGDGPGIHAFKRNSKRNLDSGNRIIIRYSDAKSTKGIGSTSARITKVEDSEPGVSLVARQIQGADDASARSVVGKYPVMHMFDAVISPLLHAIRNAQTYNQGTLDVNKNFSMFDNAVEMLSKIVEIVEDPKNAAIADILNKATEDSNSSLYEIDFKAMLKAALDTQKTIEADKKQLFEEDLVFFDHMGLENTGVDNQYHKDNEIDYESEADSETLAAWAESFLETDDLWTSPDPLKSDDGSTINHAKFVHSDSEVLSGDNAVEIFDSLGVAERQGNSTDTAEHLTYLRELLGDVIAPALNSLGKFSLRMRRAGDRNAGSIEDQEILLNFGENNSSNILLNQGSERTTYVHELVHAITRFMFDDPKFANTASEIVKLRERTRKYLNEKYNGDGWKAFMSLDENLAGHIYDTQAEITHAKGVYNYIFGQEGEFWTAGNSDKVSSRGIHEFVTFGLTDPRLLKELAEMPYRAKRIAPTTFGGRLQEIFLEVIDLIIDRVKKRGNSADKHLLQLVTALNKVDTKSKFNTNKIMQSITKIDVIAEKSFTRYVFAPIAKASLYVSTNLKGQSLTKQVIRSSSIVIGATVEGVVPQLSAKVNGQEVLVDLPFRKALEESRKRLRISKNALLIYILRTIAGPSNDMDRKIEHMLARSNMLIDQNRKNIAEGVITQIEKSFKTPMEKADWEALTLGILKTDLISLLTNNNAESIPKLIDLLRNTNNSRTNRIDDIRKQLLALGPIGNHYVKQSKGLGILMVTGKVTVRMQRMNAYMIANSKDVVPSKSMPKDLVATQQLIDQLASLYALENNVNNANANTAAIIEREYKADPKINGITQFIGQAIGVKKDALERNFKNDQTHIVKGFIKSITNPNISVKVALLSDQKLMKEMGYKLISALKDDTISDPSRNAKGLYSSDFVTMQDYNRGIMSMTSMRASGTLLSQMLATSPGENFNYSSAKKAVKAAVLSNTKEYRKHAGNPDYAITDNSVMVPVYDTNQNIVDFRYMMSDDTKVNVLKQELRSQYVLSSEVGSIEDKEKTSIVNEDALVLLKEDFDKNFLARSDEFVKISLTSGKGKYRELYNLMPVETRKAIKKVFGKDELYIDEKYIDVIFGQRSLSIADLPFLNHRIVKIAEVIWKEIVSMAKKNIVIKTGSVLYHNILSNTVVGILNGVPIEYMIKEQLRTARDLNNYMGVKRDLYVAQADLRSAEGLNDTQGIIEAKDTIKAFESVLENSPVRELIRRGMFQSITEEIDTQADPYSYASALTNKVNEFAGKNKVLSSALVGASAVGRYTYMTDDTSMYKLLLKTTQYSDFVARQAVFKYKTEVEGISKDETENLVRDLFVNYDLPDHQILQYMNETGISMFTKYPMRMLRVIFKMMKGRPVEGLMLIMLEDFMNMNIDDPTDMGFNILNSPFSIVEDAFTQSGLEMAKEVF